MARRKVRMGRINQLVPHISGRYVPRELPMRMSSSMIPVIIDGRPVALVKRSKTSEETPAIPVALRYKFHSSSSIEDKIERTKPGNRWRGQERKRFCKNVRRSPSLGRILKVLYDEQVRKWEMFCDHIVAGCMAEHP